MATKSKAPTASTGSTPATIGQRLIAALVPEHFPTLTALQLASGVAYSTLINWKNGSKLPDWGSIESMALLARRDPMELLGQKATTGAALRHHRDFDKAHAAALKRFPGRVPPSAYDYAGATCSAQWPEHIDEVFLFNLAQFWWTNTSDITAQNVEETEMRAEMAAIDAKRGR